MVIEVPARRNTNPNGFGIADALNSSDPGGAFLACYNISGATPVWTVDVVSKDTRKHVATFASLNYFNALRIKNWWTDNGVPQTASAVPEAIEVVLDRWPPIPTDLDLAKAVD